nr:DoxX family protein [Candidatus Eremiobacteraeota bacterium]
MIKPLLRAVLGASFIVLGVLHFLHTPFFVRMIPPPLDAHASVLVQISAVFEILGGAGVFVARTRRTAGIGLLALLVAVFPANIYMAVRSDLFA